MGFCRNRGMCYLSMVEIQKIIKTHFDLFLDLCRTHNVRRMYAFGSSVTGKFDEQSSDIDLLIELDVDAPIERGDQLMNLWNRLEQLFQKKIDLLTPTSVQNPFLKKNINSSKVLIYDRENAKIIA